MGAGTPLAEWAAFGFSEGKMVGSGRRPAEIEASSSLRASSKNSAFDKLRKSTTDPVERLLAERAIALVPTSFEIVQPLLGVRT
jgi:hypothetical protein